MGRSLCPSTTGANDVIFYSNKWQIIIKNQNDFSPGIAGARQLPISKGCSRESRPIPRKASPNSHMIFDH
jgi:hypothetical protein